MKKTLGKANLRDAFNQSDALSGQSCTWFQGNLGLKHGSKLGEDLLQIIFFTLHINHISVRANIKCQNYSLFLYTTKFSQLTLKLRFLMINRAFKVFFFMPLNFSGLLVSAGFSDFSGFSGFSGFSASPESAKTIQTNFFQTKKESKNNQRLKHMHEGLTFFCFYFLLLFLMIRFFLGHSHKYLLLVILFDFFYGPLCIFFHRECHISNATTFFSLCKQKHTLMFLLNQETTNTANSYDTFNV